MVHSLPDYTSKFKNTTVFSVVDNSELAARLASPNVYDRRGNVVFMDDFEGAVLQWETGGLGVGDVEDISVGNARNGSQSCILTAGAGVVGQAYIYKYLGILNPGKIGLETSFTVNSSTTYVSFQFWYYDGTEVHRGYMTYDLPNTRWFYFNDAGGDTILANGVDLRTTNSPWHTAKLVLDTNTDNYVRFIYNNTEIDMSNIGLYHTADASDSMVQIGITHYSNNAAIKSIYIDNVILTQNE